MNSVWLLLLAKKEWNELKQWLAFFPPINLFTSNLPQWSTKGRTFIIYNQCLRDLTMPASEGLDLAVCTGCWPNSSLVSVCLSVCCSLDRLWTSDPSIIQGNNQFHSRRSQILLCHAAVSEAEHFRNYATWQHAFWLSILHILQICFLEFTIIGPLANETWFHVFSHTHTPSLTHTMHFTVTA